MTAFHHHPVFGVVFVWFGLIAGLTAMSGAVHGQGADFAPGSTVQVEAPGRSGHYLVYVPTDYSPDQTWPVILYYHGYNGRPQIGPLRQVVGGRQFVIVGMDYASNEYHESPGNALRPAHPNLLPREVQNVKRVLTHLQQHLAIDPRRVFMGGFSQGGYQTSVLGEAMLGDLAGVLLLGGGRTFSGGHHPPDARLIRGKPVFLGAGENDGRHRQSIEDSHRHYQGWGANVTLDIWPGLGHQCSTTSPTLKNWLIEHGVLGDAAAQLRQAQTLAQRGQTAEAVAIYERLAAIAPEHGLCKQAASRAEALTQPHREQLDQARALFEQGQADQAIALLLDAGRTMPGTSIGRQVQEQLTAMRSDPAVAERVEQAIVDHAADELEHRARQAEQARRMPQAQALYEEYLARHPKATRYVQVKAHYDSLMSAQAQTAADQLEAGARAAEKHGDYARAITLYRRHVETYPTTARHEQIKEHLANLEQDPKVQTALASAAAADVCRPQLAMANSYLAADRPDLARPLLEKIVKDHPTTEWADQARALLARMK